MIKCQSCGTDNLDGSQFCDECGNSLQGAPAGDSYRPPVSEPSFQVASVTSIGIEPVIEQVVPATSTTGSTKRSDGVHSALVIERGMAVGREFQLSAEESLVGRWDADNGVFPDIDLDAFDPEAKISRRHARILFREGVHTIEDLGSTNGTYVNRGRRLIPGTPHRLQDGDEIIVGKTFLRFNVSR